MKKSIFAFLLMAVMVLTVLAPAAYADEEETTEATETVETTEAAEEEEETEATEETRFEVPDLDLTSGKCGDNLTWSFENGTLTVSGKGDMETSAPWGHLRDDIKKLVLTGGVTSVSDEAFKNCDNLTDIDFGDSLKSIGVQAFMGCDGLESIRLPQSFRLFDAECFRDCSNLTEINCSGKMPSFKANCLWNANTITIYTPMNNPWPQEHVEVLVNNFGGRLSILSSGGDNLYVYTQPTEEPTEEPTTEPETEAPTEPETEPPTEATEAPATEAPTVPATEAPTEAPTEVPTEIPTEPAVPDNLNNRSWIGLALIVGVLTLAMIGGLIVRASSRKGGRYSE